jgi:hypothetical protein
VRVGSTGQLVLCDLGTRDDQQVVLSARALGFLPHLGEVGLELFLGDAETPLAERGEAAGTREQILPHQDVIGDRDHVEPARAPVQVDGLAQGQAPVTPPRVHVEVAEQEWLVARHVRSSRPCAGRLSDGGG